jgi:hypothetical protein
MGAFKTPWPLKIKARQFPVIGALGPQSIEAMFSVQCYNPDQPHECSPM